MYLNSSKEIKKWGLLYDSIVDVIEKGRIGLDGSFVTTSKEHNCRSFFVDADNALCPGEYRLIPLLQKLQDTYAGVVWEQDEWVASNRTQDGIEAIMRGLKQVLSKKEGLYVGELTAKYPGFFEIIKNAFLLGFSKTSVSVFDTHSGYGQEWTGNDLKQCPGIYSFWTTHVEVCHCDNRAYEVPIYVGKSKNIAERLKTHHRSPQFELLAQLGVPLSLYVAYDTPFTPIANNLDELERELIKVLNPILNNSSVHNGYSKENDFIPDERPMIQIPIFA